MEQFCEKSYVLRDEAHPRLVLWWFPLSDTVWEFAARTGRICRFSSNTCSYLKLRIALLNVDLGLVLKKFKFRNHILSRRIFNLRMRMKNGISGVDPISLFHPYISTCVPLSVGTVAGKQRRMVRSSL